MKKITWLLIMMGISTYGQQLYLGLGKTMSRFDYKNSAGQSLENLLPKGGLFLEMGYRDVINNNETLYVSIGGIYDEFGAIGSDRTLDNYFEWDVTYVGVEGGLDYKLFSLRDFSFFLEANVSVEFLVQGTQTINNQVYNLVGEDEFNTSIFFLNGGLNMTYPISRNTLIKASYSYGRTMLIGKGNASDQEELRLLAHKIGFGIIINLPGCNCPF